MNYQLNQSNKNVIFSPSLYEAFFEAGMTYPNIKMEPGRFNRFSTSKKRGDDAGWCRLFPDGTGATFGCFRDNKSFIWQQRDENAPPPTKAELEAARIKGEQLRKEAEAERAEENAMAAKRAAEQFAEAGDVDVNHGYVVRKGIKPHGARQSDDGKVVLPVYGPDGALQSLQFIFESGSKHFLPKGKVSDGRLFLGTPENGSGLILCEGWATACSIREATHSTTVVCYSGGNLAKVAKSLRKEFPDSPLIIAGDLDEHGAGQRNAQDAVKANELSVAITPVFADGRASGDFNDLHQAEGLDAVRQQFRAIKPAIKLHPITQLAGPVYQDFMVPALPGKVLDARDGTENTRPLTQVGNALRMLDRMGERLKYVEDAKKWLVWDGLTWQWDSDGATVRTLATDLPAAIYNEGNLHLAEAESFAYWARQSQNAKNIKASVSILQDRPEIRLPLASIDADHFAVGIDNARQVVDLRTGQARPAAPSDYITKSLNVAEIGSAEKAVRWKAFLEQVFQGDLELIDWIQRFCGYLLTGSTREQFFLFCYGHGANGKSVFIETLKYIMGDYGRAIAPETLTATKRQAGAATPDLVPLAGARLAMCTETEDNTNMAESLVKGLVSGDSMVVRDNYRSSFEFTPLLKLVMIGNHQPRINGTDQGIWRRVRLVPFNQTFAPEKRDPQLLAKLKDEAPHILAWMLDGCKDWQDRGLQDRPKAIEEATDAYREDQDVLGSWLSECTEESSVETPFADLYASYKAWCIDNGLIAASAKVLGRRLKERRYETRKSNNKLLYRLGLTDHRHLGFRPPSAGPDVQASSGLRF